ncbi:MAG TPA: L,D-transpeptidase [Acetivibrio sp.]|uniref:L,D-transpeptidase n=1 Tax=Acetivibrio sp. TaxID=1872092 RepID=UPI002CA733CB|nr:L,D-transpeptidase [Acetivibrio sp.]HOM01553.1 L,D-transpeptidase [Acetivibrio sp.]
MKKKALLLSALLILIFVFHGVWTNILILDDHHPSENLLYTSIDDIPMEAEDTSVVTKGYYIYINLDELKLYLYKDGALIKTYMVSGGKPETPSPEGTWKIISKSDWGGSFGGSWMGLNVPCPT